MAQQFERCLRLGDSLYYSNPDSSYELCCCAEREARQLKDDDKTALARLCKVRYLILKTRYEEARTDLSKAITHFKFRGDKNNLAKAYNSKSILLGRLGDKEGEYEYENEAERLYEETGNIEGQVKMLSNLSLSYTYDKKFKEAEACLDKILMMLDKLAQTDIYFYYQNRGIFHMHKNEFEKAVINLEAAIDIAREKKMVDSEITALTRLAEAYILLKKYMVAQVRLKEAEKLALENKLDFELDEVYTAYISLYTAQEKYKQAFETLSLQSALREKRGHLQDIHSMSEHDKKDGMNARLRVVVGKLKNEKGNLKSKMADLRFCKWVLAGASIVLLLITGWALFTVRKLKRKVKDHNSVIPNS